MPYATFGWRVTMRITETASSPPGPSASGTVDFVLPNPGTNVGDQPYWVTGANAGERQLNAENCAKDQCQKMLTGTGRTTVVLSSSQVATR